jgi:acetyltransferase-like isoleucine patch superfamily enzyme
MTMTALMAEAERAIGPVYLGEDTFVDPLAVLGKSPRGEKAQGLETRLGRECYIRCFTTIYAGVRLGDRVQTGHGTLIRENNHIGNDVSIGTNTVLEPGNRIGNRVRIHSGCFLELVTVEDDVFIGPNVTFADDLHPPCPKYEECVGGATVKAGASIGANATILPGVSIGREALVGAGAVVVDDVPDRAVVVGNPAKVVCDIGDLTCVMGTMKPYDWRGARP